MTHLDVRGISVAYGSREVLHDVSLAAERGHFVAVLGPSGCGKTTLLRAISGFERPTTGEVALGDRVLSGPAGWVAPEQRRIGLVPQEGALFPHLDVGENVAYGLRTGPRRRDPTVAARVDECLALVGMSGSGRRRPAELSGGQQQRVALARALAPRPSLVLLDEPFSALDAALRSELRAEVRRMLRDAGATAVLVTHDQDEALSMADRVAVLLDGRVAQCADPVTLYHLPATLAVATFLGDAVVLQGRLRCDGAADSPLGAIGVRNGAPAGPAVTLMLRPEQVRLDACVPGDGNAEVTEVVFHGHDAVIALRLDGGEQARARIGGAALPPRVGDRVAATVDGTAIAY